MGNILLIFGGSSTGLEIAEVVKKYFNTRFNRIFFIVGNMEMQKIDNSIFDKDLNKFIEKQNDKLSYILSMSNQIVRNKCLESARKNNLNPVTIIHPKSYVAESANVGNGVYIAANASISSNAKIHNHVIINYNAIVGHDSVVGNHTIINPGAVIGGRVNIGERVLVGANSFIFQGKNIGSDTSIDALTYIDRDIESRKISSNRNLNIYP